VDAYAGADLLWLNKKGAIPPESVWKAGEKRTNPFKERKKFDTTDFSRPVVVNLELDEDEAEDRNQDMGLTEVID
jgi:tRNA pseudouridine38-40 synthase